MEKLFRPLLSPAQRRANARWRESVIASTPPLSDDHVGDLLVIAPHPDDETIGCAATMVRRRLRGARVRVVVVSDGGNSHRSALISEHELATIRRDESLAAADLLGIGRGAVQFLGFDSAQLRAQPQAVVSAITDQIRQFGPSEILTTSIVEWSDEHRIVAGLVRLATEESGFTGVLREFPVWHWDNGPSRAKPWASPLRHVVDLIRFRRLAAASRPGVSVPVAELRPLKEAAFACYRSQTTNLTGEETWRPFPDRWLEKFLDHEIFFTVSDASGASVAE
ncbi:PIG-L deacetylase family protein [Microbacterium sp. USTB-Y]|uniref:PIG-L deacetylase family protein n=1 Tax=Microbacterium sp. USTB-Y TaxID=2823692 RepID=UPI0020420A3C|nr:PIG-L family deacetylase [Microbacterium sp. USTB-Y]